MNERHPPSSALSTEYRDTISQRIIDEFRQLDRNHTIYMNFFRLSLLVIVIGSYFSSAGAELYIALMAAAIGIMWTFTAVTENRMRADFINRIGDLYFMRERDGGDADSEQAYFLRKFVDDTIRLNAARVDRAASFVEPTALAAVAAALPLARLAGILH